MMEEGIRALRLRDKNQGVQALRLRDGNCGSRPHRSDCRSQIVDFRLQIADFKSQISNLKSQISDLRSQIADFGFQISDLGLRKPHHGPLCGGGAWMRQGPWPSAGILAWGLPLRGLSDEHTRFDGQSARRQSTTNQFIGGIKMTGGASWSRPKSSLSVRSRMARPRSGS